MSAATMSAHSGLEEELRRRLGRARRIALVGIGDELQPRDRLGVLAAREVERLHLPGVRVFHAGTVPEAVTGPIRRFRPNHVVLVDAADMDARPGTVSVVPEGRVRARTLSTHTLPLSVTMAYLEETTHAGVTLVGIQPDLASRSVDLSPAEEVGLARFVGCMQRCLADRLPLARRRASKAL